MPIAPRCQRWHRGAIIDASSTLQRLAARINEARDLTVVTNGPDTFRALHEHPGVTALLNRGRARHPDREPRWPTRRLRRRDVLLRRLFVSAAAVDPELGSSESTLEEADVKLALAGSAGEVVLAVNVSKLDHRAPARAFPARTCRHPCHRTRPRRPPPRRLPIPRPRPVTATSNPFVVEVRSSFALRLRRYRRADCQSDCQSTDDYLLDPGRLSRQEDQLRGTAKNVTER